MLLRIVASEIFVPLSYEVAHLNLRSGEQENKDFHTHNRPHETSLRDTNATKLKNRRYVWIKQNTAGQL
jgi:hypothetical protein